MRAVEGVFAIYDEASDASGKSCEELALPLCGHVGFSPAFSYGHRSDSEGFNPGDEIVKLFPSIVSHS